MPLWSLNCRFGGGELPVPRFEFYLGHILGLFLFCPRAHTGVHHRLFFLSGDNEIDVDLLPSPINALPGSYQTKSPARREREPTRALVCQRGSRHIAGVGLGTEAALFVLVDLPNDGAGDLGVDGVPDSRPVQTSG